MVNTHSHKKNTAFASTDPHLNNLLGVIYIKIEPTGTLFEAMTEISPALSRNIGLKIDLLFRIVCSYSHKCSITYLK